jgi:hypothetical protein
MRRSTGFPVGALWDNWSRQAGQHLPLEQKLVAFAAGVRRRPRAAGGARADDEGALHPVGYFGPASLSRFLAGGSVSYLSTAGV